MKHKRQRYDHDVIARRVEAARVERGLMVKDMAQMAGVTLPAWYKKTRRLGSTFTLEELGRIADALGAPEGWPFVEWR